MSLTTGFILAANWSKTEDMTESDKEDKLWQPYPVWWT